VFVTKPGGETWPAIAGGIEDCSASGCRLRIRTMATWPWTMPELNWRATIGPPTRSCFTASTREQRSTSSAGRARRPYHQHVRFTGQRLKQGGREMGRAYSTFLRRPASYMWGRRALETSSILAFDPRFGAWDNLRFLGLREPSTDSLAVVLTGVSASMPWRKRRKSC